MKFIRVRGRIVPIRDQDEYAHKEAAKAYKVARKKTAYNRSAPVRVADGLFKGTAGAVFGGTLGFAASTVFAKAKHFNKISTGAMVLGAGLVGGAYGKYGARKKGYDEKKALGTWADTYRKAYRRVKTK